MHVVISVHQFGPETEQCDDWVICAKNEGVCTNAEPEGGGCAPKANLLVF